MIIIWINFDMLYRRVRARPQLGVAIFFT